MIADQARRWLPWVVSWVGWAVLIFEGDIAGRNRLPWGLVFAVALACSVVAGVTRRRGAMNLLVALVIVIGLVRSLRYAQLEAWGPQGVWLVVLGAHLTTWLATPFTSVSNLDCQLAETCPRRVPLKVGR